MIFAKLDVCFYRHTRFHRAGLEASGLWAAALTFLRENDSTDGRIAEDELWRLFAVGEERGRKLADRLVEVGLFEPADGGYILCRYAAKNETREEIEARRAATRERVAAHRAANRPKAAGKHVRKRNAVTLRAQAPLPTPLPSPVTPGAVPGSGSGSGSGSVSSLSPGAALPQASSVAHGSTPKAPKATRLPRDWQPSPEAITRFAEREHVDAGPDAHSAETFRNYWWSKKKDAERVDWEATYRNWVLEDIARGRATPTVRSVTDGHETSYDEIHQSGKWRRVTVNGKLVRSEPLDDRARATLAGQSEPQQTLLGSEGRPK